MTKTSRTIASIEEVQLEFNTKGGGRHWEGLHKQPDLAALTLVVFSQIV